MSIFKPSFANSFVVGTSFVSAGLIMELGKSSLGDKGAVFHLDQANQGAWSVIVEWMGAKFSATLSDGSINDSFLIAAARQSPEFGEDVHKSIAQDFAGNVLVAPLVTASHRYHGAIFNNAMMEIARAVSGQSDDTPGYIFHGGSEKLFRSDQLSEPLGKFDSAIRRMGAKEPDAISELPLFDWIGLRPFGGQENAGAYTRGLSAFTGYEIEVNPRLPLNEAMKEIAGLAYGAAVHGINFPQTLNQPLAAADGGKYHTSLSTLEILPNVPTVKLAWSAS